MSDKKIETVAFGGGCFWCTEAVFKMLKGVKSVEPGYTGGNKIDPTYMDVCSGTSGHAEVSKVEYGPSEIDFKDLLTVFFSSHDPTSLNRQGPDVGTQYRSVVFYTTEEQKKEIEKMIKKIDNSAKGDKVVTEVVPLDKFYPAEDYHKNYYNKNHGQAYCRIVINPKVEHVRQQFGKLLNKNYGK